MNAKTVIFIYFCIFLNTFLGPTLMRLILSYRGYLISRAN